MVLVLVNAVNLLDGLDGSGRGRNGRGRGGLLRGPGGRGSDAGARARRRGRGLPGVERTARARVSRRLRELPDRHRARAALSRGGATTGGGRERRLLVPGGPGRRHHDRVCDGSEPVGPLLRGDRGHVYDQLVDRGWSAPTAVVVCVAAQARFTVAGIGIAELSRAPPRSSSRWRRSPSSARARSSRSPRRSRGRPSSSRASGSATWRRCRRPRARPGRSARPCVCE